MKVTTIGLDLAKNVFQVHGVDECGKAALRRQLKRTEMSAYFAKLEPCLPGDIYYPLTLDIGFYPPCCTACASLPDDGKVGFA